MRDLYDTNYVRAPDIASNVIMSMMRNLGGDSEYMLGYVAVTNDKDINIYGSFAIEAMYFLECRVPAKVHDFPFNDCSTLYRIPLELVKNRKLHNEMLFF